MKTTLLVCTLNEVNGMRVIMPRVRQVFDGQIIVLDGGSTDGTVEYAQAQDLFVYVQKQPGLRHAYVEALPYIEGDILITFSPDGNSIPDLIPELIRKMEGGYDMVIASRYLPPARSEDDDLITAFGNWFFTRTVNWLHGGTYTDAMVMFRAYRKQTIFDLDLDKDESFALAERLFFTRISWEPLLSARAAKRKLKVTEIPGDEPPRIGGTRKLKVLQWGAAYYFQFWQEVWRWR